MGHSGLSRGERNAEWIEQYCRIPEGRDVGKPVRLTDEQKNWIKSIYDSPTRQFILSMARKNAKTSFSAFLLLLHLAGPEARKNSQLYSAAQSRDQAAILFALAAKMVRMSPDLSAFVLVRDSAKQLFCAELGTLYKALSAEASTAYGLSPVFAVHDELGQVRGPRSELYEAIETACAAQDEPLSIIISTQAPNDADLLSLKIDDALKGEDKLTKVVLYTADESLDAFSEEAIRQANPHFDAFMNKAEVMRQAESARRMPSAENAYRNLILNQRISLHSTFIPRGIWKNCGGAVEEEAFHFGPVFIGLDLSARNDLTALVMIAKYQEAWHVRPRFFAPALGLLERGRRDRVPYDVWKNRGFLETTPGASVDYETVAVELCRICDEYPVAGIAFDRWRIDVLKSELARLNAELPMVEFGQGFKDMAPALDNLEGELMNKSIRHGDHPVLTWCASNAIAISDPSGNRKLDKSKATGRIDGIVALAMAMGCATSKKEERKPEYEMFFV